MIFEHEIPQGTKLYFGSVARLKREIENTACEVLYNNGFEEIITPSFVYLEHQKNFSNREIIRLSSQNNHQISLRYDTTIDAIRIITKRLERSTNQKKWFYIQPVFSYPTKEIHQIGTECLDINEMPKILCLCVEMMKKLNIEPILQISNVKILKLCANEMGIKMDKFATMHIENMLQKDDYLSDLLKVQTCCDLEDFIKVAPSFLKTELESLLQSASYCKCGDCEYKKVIFSPLSFAPIDYYNDLVFRMFEGNHTLLLGGKYTIEETNSCGFGIYTDNIVDYLIKEETKTRK